MSIFGIGITAADVRRVVWTLIFAFLASLYATATGWSSLPNMTEAKAAVVSAGIAAFAAVFSLIKNGVLADDSPLK